MSIDLLIHSIYIYYTCKGVLEHNLSELLLLDQSGEQIKMDDWPATVFLVDITQLFQVLRGGGGNWEKNLNFFQ